MWFNSYVSLRKHSLLWGAGARLQCLQHAFLYGSSLFLCSPLSERKTLIAFNSVTQYLRNTGNMASLHEWYVHASMVSCVHADIASVLVYWCGVTLLYSCSSFYSCCLVSRACICLSSACTCVRVYKWLRVQVVHCVCMSLCICVIILLLRVYVGGVYTCSGSHCKGCSIGLWLTSYRTASSCLT